MNIFTVKVNMIMKKIGFNPLKINRRGTLERNIVKPRKATVIANPKKSLTKKREMM